MTLTDLLTADVPDPSGDTTMRSPHYMAFIAKYPCMVTVLTGEEQESRTTVHHIVKRGIAKKGPDWWTVPVSKKRHVHGKHSIDKLGKEGFREHWSLPDWRLLPLIFLYQYIDGGHDEEVIPQSGRRDIEPRPIDRRSARRYFNRAQRLINNGKSFHGWTWSPA